MYCCTDLKKCCPEMYAAYTKSVEEQSISGIMLLFFKKHPPLACNSQNTAVFLPIIFFIDNINWFYLHCCKCLKKCCPEMYAAYTQSVEEQSISQKFTRLVTWSCRRTWSTCYFDLIINLHLEFVLFCQSFSVLDCLDLCISVFCNLLPILVT